MKKTAWAEHVKELQNGEVVWPASMQDVLFYRHCDDCVGDSQFLKATVVDFMSAIIPWHLASET